MQTRSSAKVNFPRNAEPRRLDELERKQLEEQGYVALRAILSPVEVETLNARLAELWQQEGERAGAENYIEPNARRLANLANKGDVFRPIFAHPVVLEAVRQVIGLEVRVSMLNARAVPPHSDPRQPLHSDADHGARPDETGYFVSTAIWMLDDFTLENGATHLVPGSHRSPLLPKEALADVNAPHPEEVRALGKAGDVLVFNGHCWHAGGQNTTGKERRALLVHYIRADHPQRLPQKDFLAPEIQARFDPLERELLGLNDAPSGPAAVVRGSGD